MKNLFILLSLSFIISCSHTNQSEKQTNSSAAVGSWKLIKAMTIENQDTTTTDYTENKKAIKIISDSHFAFFQHDLNKGRDSLKVFVSGAGKCTINGNTYTEHLEFCNYREWEGHTFNFELKVKNDTLVQKGIEKIDSLGVDRVIIETYVKLVD